MKLFANQMMPSAWSGGNIVLIDRLTAPGVPCGMAVATLSLSLFGFCMAYALLALLMLLTLWFGARLRRCLPDS
jgi:hypothetical protein